VAVAGRASRLGLGSARLFDVARNVLVSLPTRVSVGSFAAQFSLVLLSGCCAARSLDGARDAPSALVAASGSRRGRSCRCGVFCRRRHVAPRPRGGGDARVRWQRESEQTESSPERWSAVLISSWGATFERGGRKEWRQRGGRPGEAVSGPHFVAHCSSASVSVRRPRNFHEVGDVVVASVVTRRAAGWRPRCGCDARAGCQ